MPGLAPIRRAKARSTDIESPRSFHCDGRISRARPPNVRENAQKAF